MFRFLSTVSAMLAMSFIPPAADEPLKGDYLETRTCDVYTGPCFANGQVGLCGNDAMMAWNIERGTYGGVSLAGLKVVVVTTATDTLGFGGTLKINPQEIRSLIIADSKATEIQHEALVKFAKQHARHAGEIVKVVSTPIEMSADHFEAVGILKAGDLASIKTRRLNKGDCVCSNEETFYPPLNDVKNATAAYTESADFNGPALGTKWSNPGTRSAFLASFSY
jgi:hypothetical protein